jgi:hypothetical protein
MRIILTLRRSRTGQAGKRKEEQEEIVAQKQEAQEKWKLLRERVVALVQEFIAQEGGINIMDLWRLFGEPRFDGLYPANVAAALSELPISLGSAPAKTGR